MTREPSSFLSGLLLWTALITSPASADAPTLEWHYPKFGAGEIVLSSLAGATLITSAIIGPRSNHWTARNDFDEAGRDALRIRHSFRREVARDTSDVLLALTISYPFLIDSLVMAAWYHHSPKTALQLTYISAEAMLVTAAIMSVAKTVGSRERPFLRTCGSDELPDESVDCRGRNLHQSFFSGHAATTFTAAAATCMHHANLPIHERRNNIWPCVSTILSASFAALFRVMSDQHYLSDVITGAGIGTAVGLFIPWLFHYRHGAPESRRVMIAPAPRGLALQVILQ